MIFERKRLFGVIAAGLLCAGIGATEAGARAACQPAAAQANAADRLCQPVKRSQTTADRSGRFRIAQILPFDCVDRCIADFKTCMGPPPRTDPPVIGNDPPVKTTPPYEFCIGVQDQCIAACKEAAGRKTRF
jgi:hypothetical protein